MTDKFTKYEYSLLSLIEELHMRNTGSYLDMSAKRKSAAQRAILNRIVNWTPSPPFCKVYDDIVLALCKEVLIESEKK